MTALNSILKTANITTPSLDNIIIEGKDPILPTPFLLGEAGGAALAAIGYMAAELWYLKTKRQQTVHITVRDAAICQRSHCYLTIVDGETPALWSPISGFYQTQDHRWIQLHCNFPHHKTGVLKFLNCKDDKTSVQNAIKQWDAEKLETELSNLSLCAAMIRSPTEWHASEHYQATAALPLFDIIKIGDSDPEPLPTGSMPLSGIKALDLTRVISGPVCGKTLAEHGATVMRVSSPNLPFIPPLVMDTGQGKLSTYLDLRQAADKTTLNNLIKTADVFSQSYRPGAMDEMGYSPRALAKLRPGIIYVSLSAYSHVGPWANKHGYDSLVQSATGIVHEQSNGKTPQHLPAQSLDYITGFLSAFATMLALKQRALHGGSYLIRVSLLQTAHWLQNLGRVKGEYSQCQLPQKADVTDLLIEQDSAFGRLQYLKPVLKLSETQPFYAFPSVPLGTDKPLWP